MLYRLESVLSLEIKMSKYKVHIELQFEKKPTSIGVLHKLFDLMSNNSIKYTIEKGKKND